MSPTAAAAARFRTAVLSAAVAFAAPAVTSAQETSEPTPADLTAQIRQLQDRVRELETRQTRLSDAQIQSTIESVLTDAERRSRLFAAEGATAGWDNGFVIRSADGNYVLKPGVLFQFRNVTDYRENLGGDDDDQDLQHGFEIRRTQLIFQGNAISPDLYYFFMWESGRDGGTVLQDAFVTYKFAAPWAFKVGQYFDPVSHELLSGPPRRLAVEPSVADFLIGGGRQNRVQGASLIYGGYHPNTPVNVEVAITDGLSSQNTSFQDVNTNVGVAGRAEFKCFGDWPAYRDFTAAANKNDLLVFGIAGDYTDAPNQSTVMATADAQYEVDRWALYGALLMRYTDLRNAPAGGDGEAFDWGGVAQAAYLFTDRCEGFVRYSLTNFDDATTPAGSDDAIHEFCVGTNYYVVPGAPHRAKITVDLTYLPNGAPASLSAFSIGGGTDDDEVVLRAQFQLLI